MKIEIGGGTLLTNGYINLDYIHGTDPWKRYAQDTPWPTGDNTVDAIRASHVLEHIPIGDDRVAVMNEAYRVLKPGRIFEIIVPLAAVRGVWTASWEPWADPFHCSFWVYPESFLYFTEGAFKANADYGISYWQALDDSICEIRHGWEGVVRLKKP